MIEFYIINNSGGHIYGILSKIERLKGGRGFNSGGSF